MAKRRRTKRNTSNRVTWFSVHDHQAPTENADAGDDRDLHDARIAEQIRAYRGSAKRHFEAAKALASSAPEQADAEARLAIDHATRAFWWAEDSEAEEKQHTLMHQIGRWTRRNVGCSLTFDGASYSHTCPIRIAHKRIGLSPGIVAQCICSICGEDLSECEHIVGRSYWVTGGPVGESPCRVCFGAECQQHRPDRLYRGPVVKVVTTISEMREVSWVSRPANPEARLLSLPIDTASLAQAFGPEFTLGMRLSCDQCLDECSGFDELQTEPDRAEA